jgi:hypothetical protein
MSHFRYYRSIYLKRVNKVIQSPSQNNEKTKPKAKKPSEGRKTKDMKRGNPDMTACRRIRMKMILSEENPYWWLCHLIIIIAVAVVESETVNLPWIVLIRCIMPWRRVNSTQLFCKSINNTVPSTSAPHFKEPGTKTT